MTSDGQPPEIFDRNRRRALRERAAHRGVDSFLWALIAEELADRLVGVSRTFTDVLVVGPIAPFAQQILHDRKARLTLAEFVEEDRLPFEPASFDLVISAGSLDSVNDLPGALIQIRRCLRPDGLFLGHMFGAGTLAGLKAVMLAAHEHNAGPHIHPQIDLRSAADLLSRTGFALPVVDSDFTAVRYSSLQRLVSDLRDIGAGNALAGPHAYLGRTFIERMEAALHDRKSHDGKFEEQFAHIYMSGWAPSDNQPKPAKRGSGQVSLTAILSRTDSTD